MSKFFVGQRVRIVYSLNRPELAGEEGWVVPLPAHLPCFNNQDGRPWAVAPDCWGRCYTERRADGTADWFGPGDDQLEPIVLDGHQPAELSLHELLPFLREPAKETTP